MAVEMLDGNSLTVGITDGAVTIGAANVVMADIVTTNGVIHVIDTVLQPPASTAEETGTEGSE